MLYKISKEKSATPNRKVSPEYTIKLQTSRGRKKLMIPKIINLDSERGQPTIMKNFLKHRWMKL